MTIKLKKGQKIDLTKNHPGLKSMLVGLGWNTSMSNSGQNIDLDASVFICDSQGNVSDERDFVYYNNPNHYSGGVNYSGDSKTGSSQGDDEVITLELNRLPQNIAKISFSVTIYDAARKRQNFGMVDNAYIRIVNMENNEEIMKFDLGRDYSVETAVVIAEIYRHGDEWKFNAIGSGFQGGLGALCRNFGLDVEDENEGDSSNIQSSNSNQSFVPQTVNQQSYQNQQNNQQYNQQYNHQTNYPVQVPQHQQQGHFVDLSRSQHPSGGFNSQPQGGQFNSFDGNNQNNMNNQQASCPNCRSSRTTAGKKGFRLGQAAVGVLALGPIGLLGGLLGSNKMEFLCLDCNHRWSPNEGGIKDWLNNQANNSRQIIASHGNNRQLANALVASAALVATADGRLDDSEKNKMIGYFRASSDLASLDINYVVNKFNEFISKMQFDIGIGQDECFREIISIRNDTEVCKLVVRFACAIGYADGHFSPVEQQMVIKICNELYLNPQEFIQ